MLFTRSRSLVIRTLGSEQFSLQCPGLPLHSSYETKLPTVASGGLPGLHQRRLFIPDAVFLQRIAHSTLKGDTFIEHNVFQP